MGHVRTEPHPSGSWAYPQCFATGFVHTSEFYGAHPEGPSRLLLSNVMMFAFFRSAECDVPR
eukprot:2765552-Alexandrium_andersonii.AAC.1